MIRVSPSADLYAEVLPGDGPPVAVMHGGLGLNHAYLRPWLDDLTSAGTLVYYDHRGHGRSPAPDDWDAVTHRSLADDADGLRERLGYERWTVFGHSYGGFLALEYALAYPDHTAALVLCCTAPVFDPGEAAFARAARLATPEQLATLASAFSSPFPSDEAMAAAYPSVLPVYFADPSTSGPIVDALTDGLTYSAAGFNRAFFGCLPDYDLRDRLGDINAPVLVLSGRHDWLFTPEHDGEALASRLPQAEHVVFERSGHNPFAEEPERFAAVVTKWLRTHVSSTTGPA